MKSRKTRLADVAREAGVSPATVSRFMRGTAPIAAETRERIEAAVDRLGTILPARKTSRIIAFVLSNRGFLNTFHSAVMLGAEAFCAENDYGLLFLPMQYSMSSPSRRIVLPPFLLRRDVVAGAVLAGVNSLAMLDVLHDHKVPWVALGNNVVGGLEEPPASVFFDEFQGAYDVTCYLLSLGHRNIAFTGNLSLPWYSKRFHGYQKAMIEAGLSPTSGELGSLDSEEMGYLGTRLVLQRSPKPTAIFAGDDRAAMGVYKAARDHGLRIPEDLSVVGFDDNPESANFTPPLTSVRVFTYELGRQAAALLLQSIAHPNVVPASITLPTQVMRRESAMPPTTAKFQRKTR